MEDSRNQRQAIGKLGEDAACKFLLNKGHQILARNYRSGHLEIDIISVSAYGIHFVEVKSRCKSIQAPPQDNVDHAKQRRIASAAKRFLRGTKGLPYNNSECHFDIIAVVFTDKEIQLEYFPDAFIPIYL